MNRLFRALWLPRETGRRLVRVAFSRKLGDDLGPRSPDGALAPCALHPAARLRGRGDEGRRAQPSTSASAVAGLGPAPLGRILDVPDRDADDAAVRDRAQPAP